MITIRPANKTDLNDIAQVHIACFPESFSSQIGGGSCLGFIQNIWLFTQNFF